MDDQAVWRTQPPAAGWPPPPAAGWPPPPAGVRRGTPWGLVVAGLVVSVCALVAVLALAGWLAITGVLFPVGGESLTGRLPEAPAEGALPGPVLASAVGSRITEDGGDVSTMTCPSTPSVAQGVVTVCHGSISGAAWSVVVIFEDAAGTFTLDPV